MASASGSAWLPSTMPASASAMACELRGAGVAEHEGQAEEEDGARERAQQEVLDGALGGEPVALGEAGQQVARQHQQLEAQEEDEQVLAAGDEHAAADGEEQRGRELGQRQPPRRQVVGREEQGQQADADEHHVEEDGEQVARVERRVAERAAAPRAAPAARQRPDERASPARASDEPAEAHGHDQARRGAARRGRRG